MESWRFLAPLHLIILLTSVLLYQFLCGICPFLASKRLVFTCSAWENVSPQAVSLIRKLLVVNPKKRCDVKQALSHSWILQPPNRSTVIVDSDSEEIEVVASSSPSCSPTSQPAITGDPLEDVLGISNGTNLPTCPPSSKRRRIQDLSGMSSTCKFFTC